MRTPKEIVQELCEDIRGTPCAHKKQRRQSDAAREEGAQLSRSQHDLRVQAAEIADRADEEERKAEQAQREHEARLKYERALETGEAVSPKLKQDEASLDIDKLAQQQQAQRLAKRRESAGRRASEGAWFAGSFEGAPK
jgi:hypothetical protein